MAIKSVIANLIEGCLIRIKQKIRKEESVDKREEGQHTEQRRRQVLSIVRSMLKTVKYRIEKK